MTKKFNIVLGVLLIIASLFFNSNLAIASNESVTVATSANVQFAMNELKKEFEKQTGIEVKPIISSSGKLASQILNLAPFDVFISADMEFPEKLYKENFAVTKPCIYAHGLLVLWTMKDLDLSKGLDILKQKEILKIAIANTRTAPYGKEALKILSKTNILKDVQEKLVYGESISQVNNYIISNTADIGFTAKSVVLSPEMKNKGKWVEVNKKLYSPIPQGIVILKHGKENNYISSKKFYDFMLSESAKKILEKYGYIVEKAKK